MKNKHMKTRATEEAKKIFDRLQVDTEGYGLGVWLSDIFDDYDFYEQEYFKNMKNENNNS